MTIVPPIPTDATPPPLQAVTLKMPQQLATGAAPRRKVRATRERRQWLPNSGQRNRRLARRQKRR